jgi:hypothetical protein
MEVIWELILFHGFIAGFWGEERRYMADSS